MAITPFQKMIARGLILLPDDRAERPTTDWCSLAASALVFGFVGFVLGVLVISITAAH